MKKQKLTLRAARRIIKEYGLALNKINAECDILRNDRNKLIEREKELVKKLQFNNTEKFVTQIGQLLQSVATINEAVSKVVLSKDNNL